MSEFDLTPETKARNTALEAQKRWKETQGQVSVFESKLEAAKREEREYRQDFVDKVNEYYCLKFGVKPGSIIVCDGEEYEFVKFQELSKDPIVKHKLKSGKFSKRTHQIHLYNWDTKTREKLGGIRL